ncbi:MAG: acetolactate synthase [Firmicutes bacterium]|nr:acetolactate synthase [Bacillota bacterium]
MTIDQVYFYLDNNPGELVEVLRLFAREGIDMRAYSVAENNEYGVFRMIVRDPGAALEALRRGGIDAAKNRVLGIVVPDEPGGTVRAFEALSQAGINVRYSYAFAMARLGKAFIILRVNDNAKAAEILAAAGVQLVGNSDIF